MMLYPVSEATETPVCETKTTIKEQTKRMLDLSGEVAAIASDIRNDICPKISDPTSAETPPITTLQEALVAIEFKMARTRTILEEIRGCLG